MFFQQLNTNSNYSAVGTISDYVYLYDPINSLTSVKFKL